MAGEDERAQRHFDLDGIPFERAGRYRLYDPGELAAIEMTAKEIGSTRR